MVLLSVPNGFTFFYSDNALDFNQGKGNILYDFIKIMIEFLVIRIISLLKTLKLLPLSYGMAGLVQNRQKGFIQWSVFNYSPRPTICIVSLSETIISTHS